MNATNQPAGRTTDAATPEEIQQEIERTRAQLGETAGALAHKLDARAQAKERIDHARSVTQEKAHRAQEAGRELYRDRPTVVVGVGVVVAAALVAAVVWRRNS